jgi:hypothetical protein
MQYIFKDAEDLRDAAGVLAAVLRNEANMYPVFIDLQNLVCDFMGHSPRQGRNHRGLRARVPAQIDKLSVPL